MKKILPSILVIAVVALAAVAGTSAWFSSTKTIAANTLATGTLEVALTDDLKPSTTLDFGEAKLEPGASTDNVSVLITNDGTINLGWLGYFNVGGIDALKDVIYIKYARMEFLNPAKSGTWEATDIFIIDGRGAGTYAAHYNTLADISDYHVVTLRNWNLDNAMGAGGGVQMGALKPEYHYRFTFSLGMANEAGNEFQNKALPLSYTVTSTQIQAGALDVLFTNNDRLQSPGSNHLVWMSQQIAKQI